MKNQIIEVKISDIKIGNRHRKEMGDIEELAQSIKETELLQPIGITPDHELVFGERRLRAYRDIMKLETIPARIIEVDSVLHARITEDVMRKDYSLTERVAIVETLCTFKHGGDRRSTQDGNCEDETVKLNKACKRAGLSKDSFYRAKEVQKNGIPELVEQMDNGEIAVSAAAEVSKAPVEEQRECMKRRFDGDKLTARAVNKKLREIENRKKRDEALTRAVQEVDKDDSIQIHHCSFQQLEKIAGIELESVQLICTDIPYGNEFIDQIGELAAFSKRVLVSGGLFVAYLGHHRFNEKLRALDEHLKFQWLNTSTWVGVGNVYSRLNLVSKSIPIVVYSKGEWTPRTRWVDTYVSQVQEKDWHPWQRPLHEVEKLVQYFSNPSDLVVDPCGGGFTTAIACLRNHRRFIGCDIDKAALVKGQERLDEERNGQVKLPMREIKVNSVAKGDCRDLIPALPDASINLCLCSPPYAERRNRHYPGVPEGQYADFTVEWMTKLWDKLTDDGSVLIVIDPHVKDGSVADYVLRTQIALRGSGWKQPPSRIWFKRDRGPIGRRDWPRHVYEEILWFTKTANPFCDPRADGKLTDHLTMNDYAYSRWTNGGKPGKKGIARVTDVIDVPIGGNAKGVKHPAKFPVALPEKLITTYCPSEGTVLDNFCGSGSTLIAAKKLGRAFYGFDIEAESVELSKRRLEELDQIEPPSLPQAS
ncbi:DNA methyltransferase [Gimesia aquarii]|uniref:Modification methylase PvuII n=1 Tax=Gimesia aquarii TaxID=2527964 RepID=A0A517VQR2_9PLAN|nr:DNA methyltransferase [Gimesia aquarii]QDT95289.1 Modification methylase PvuII [Gimesia aquarii]